MLSVQIVSSTLDMNLVKPLILHNAGYMVCLVHVKDDGALVTPPWNQLIKCRHSYHINDYDTMTQHNVTYVYLFSVDRKGCMSVVSWTLDRAGE